MIQGVLRIPITLLNIRHSHSQTNRQIHICYQLLLYPHESQFEALKDGAVQRFLPKRSKYTTLEAPSASILEVSVIVYFLCILFSPAICNYFLCLFLLVHCSDIVEVVLEFQDILGQIEKVS